jgi:mannose PTS system EIIC component
MLIKTTLIAGLGALLCLDRVCFQFMISRPIVAASSIGLFLGDLKTGLIIGAFLELLWVDRPALGNYIPPNDSLMAVFISAATILAGTQMGHVSRNLIAFSFLAFLPLSYVTQRIDIYLTASNDKLSDGALEDAKKGDMAAVERKHLYALLKTFLTFMLVIFAATVLGTYFLTNAYPLLPASAIRALDLVFFAFPVLIVAVTLHSIQMRGDIAVFCTIFIAAILITELFYVR